MFTTVVTGLPRSGTSMLMKMLSFGGMDVVSNIAPDTVNPAGIYEHTDIQTLLHPERFTDLQGKAVKVMFKYFSRIPDITNCKVILARRPIHQIIASQQRIGLPHDIADLLKPLGTPYLPLWFSDTIAHPKIQACRIQKFLDLELDTDKMATAIDPKLPHRYPQ